MGGGVTGLTMPCHLSIAHSLEGGGGWGDRSDNALLVYQYHTGWRWGGGVIGLTLPCQSINTTQAGGGGGGVIGLTLPC